MRLSLFRNDAVASMLVHTGANYHFNEWFGTKYTELVSSWLIVQENKKAEKDGCEKVTTTPSPSPPPSPLP